jgi:type IV pilus assembly protein PilY1
MNTQGKTMKKINKSLIVCLIGSLIGQLLAPGMAYATISNAPPLVKPNVPPNIFYTLDDSGSMMWEMMPDNIARTGNGDVTGTGYNNYIANGVNTCGAVGSAQECWVTNVFPKPSNLYNVGGSGDYETRKSIIVGFGNNITVARWRSSDVNKAYYDPKVLYQPWADPNGGLMGLLILLLRSIIQSLQMVARMPTPSICQLIRLLPRALTLG